jgi:hypothetical protein
MYGCTFLCSLPLISAAAAALGDDALERVQSCNITDRAVEVQRSAVPNCMRAGPRLARFKGAVAWENHLDLSQPVLFVQIGAHEGSVGDAIWPYATTCSNWRGLLLEPVGTSFIKLCNNYRPHSLRIRPLKAAVSDFAGHARMQIMRNGCAAGQCNHLLRAPRTDLRSSLHRPPVPRCSTPHPCDLCMTEPGHFPTPPHDSSFWKDRWLPGVPAAPADKGDNVKWHHSWARTNEVERVPVLTLARVWEELQRAHGHASAVDLLVVDVEGSEARILGRELPWPRPRLIMFEHKHLQPKALLTINSSLEAQGYRFVGGVAGGIGGDVTARHGDWLWRRGG